MFADLHHVSLDQGGSVAATSVVGGTIAGPTSIYFGAAHIASDNVAESWLGDDQAANLSVGLDRGEGAFNSYAAIKADWSDTVFFDNIRGADATGTGVAGTQEITGANPGNTIHTISSDTFYSD